MWRFYSILKYKWIKRSLKHARFFGHDGAAGVFEIEQVEYLIKSFETFVSSILFDVTRYSCQINH
jgi:hypothetical protein